jgi:flagellar basal-body rod modification protein FlgD
VSVSANETIANAQTNLRNMATKSKNSQELQKDDFMNLFLTQVSHQSPTDPMDSGAMMSQMAQLGSMEQLENLNNQMKALNNTQGEIARFQALQFLEKDVLLETEQVSLNKGSGNPVFFNLDKEANNIRISVEEKDGTPVFNQELGLTSAGKHRFVWEGKNSEGILMGDGNYNINFIVNYLDGTSGRVQSFNSGRVNQIEYRDGKPWVKTAHKSMPLSQVKTIDNTSQRLFGNAKPLPIMNHLPPKALITK